MKRLLFIGLLMAMISCNTDSKQDWSGMEYYTFDVTGKVTDKSGTAIAGINVEAQGVKTTTLSDGTYRLKGNGNGVLTTLYVTFSDTDAEENGGEFVQTVKGITPTYVTGAHGPYLGLFALSNVNVSLAPAAVITPPSTDQPIPLP